MNSHPPRVTAPATPIQECAAAGGSTPDASAGRLFPRLYVLAAVAVGLLLAPAAASAHDWQQGQWGVHDAANVACYGDGTISVEPVYGRVAYSEPERLAHLIYLYNIDTRTYSFPFGGWQVIRLGRDDQLDSGSLKRYLPRAIAPGNYYVGLYYAWDRGFGWTMDWTWTRTYMWGDGFFGVPLTYCRLQPFTATGSIP